MNASGRSYRYIGPADLAQLVRPGFEGRAIRTSTDFSTWVEARRETEFAEPFTFVIDSRGILRLAPRRSEHVVCAGGGQVLSAGEIGFARRGTRWAVVEVSNQSTGYCPDPLSWSAVASALDRVGLARPNRFTHEVVFRRCPGCRERSVVKDGDFVCVFCGADLPPRWNIDELDKS